MSPEHFALFVALRSRGSWRRLASRRAYRLRASSDSCSCIRRGPTGLLRFSWSGNCCVGMPSEANPATFIPPPSSEKASRISVSESAAICLLVRLEKATVMAREAAMGLMCVVSENGATYVPRHAIVYNAAAAIDALVKIALASAGFASVQIVRSLDSSVTTSIVTEPPLTKDPRTRTALSVSFNSETLHALAPWARVEIGSLMSMFPGTQWSVDGGSQVVNWGASTDALIASVPTMVKVPTTAKPAPPQTNRAMKSAAKRRVLFHFGVVPDVFSEGVARFSRRLTHVDGLTLKNGDVVQDVDGIQWYFDNGVLSDHVRTTVLAKTVRVLDDGQAVGPRASDASAPASYVSGGNHELRIVWPVSDGGGTTVFSAKAFPPQGAHDASWGWWLDAGRATVEHPRGVCQGEFGIMMDRATPELCVKDGGTWDRPCTTDTECPFYDARRGRGGCDRGGFCEMPLGVDRRSFRSAADTSHAMRHGCPPDHPQFPWCRSSPALDVRFGEKQGDA
jgi:hypothetical protein